MNDGGSPFACDPALAASIAPVVWRPELVPHAVILVPAPDGFASARRLQAFPGEAQSPGSRSGNCHYVLNDAGGAHRLWLRDLSSEMPIAALIPLDESVLLRLAGLLRFLRHLDGRPAGPLPRAWAITARLRRRLISMVRALDGHLAGASYREIAVVINGPDAISKYPWKTSSVRGQTIRLVKDAVATMEGGYRQLLRAKR